MIFAFMNLASYFQTFECALTDEMGRYCQRQALKQQYKNMVPQNPQN